MSRIEQFITLQPPTLETIHDPQKLLEHSRPSIEKKIAQLQKSYPQLILRFSFCQTPEPFTPSIFAFWLHNCSPEPPESKIDRQWMILIHIDHVSGKISSSLGYAIETFIDKRTFEQSLSTMGNTFSVTDWTQGLLEFIQNMQGTLTEATNMAKKRLKALPPA